jgi:hypothetical protein
LYYKVNLVHVVVRFVHPEMLVGLLRAQVASFDVQPKSANRFLLFISFPTGMLGGKINQLKSYDNLINKFLNSFTKLALSPLAQVSLPNLQCLVAPRIFCVSHTF